MRVTIKRLPAGCTDLDPIKVERQEVKHIEPRFMGISRHFEEESRGTFGRKEVEYRSAEGLKASEAKDTAEVEEDFDGV